MNEPIFYDTNLTATARKLRHNATPAEEKIWTVLRGRKMQGYKFTRQKPIYYFILDFYCAELLLGIEIDGRIHTKLAERDTERSVEIESFGIKIIRYKNEEVLNNLENVQRDLSQQITKRKQELKSSSLTRLTSPNPSLSGGE